jgi:hypothetical protein
MLRRCSTIWQHERGSQYVAERAELVDNCPILFAMRGFCFGTARGGLGARLDGAKFRKRLKIGGISPADLDGAGFGLRYSSLIGMPLNAILKKIEIETALINRTNGGYR